MASDSHDAVNFSSDEGRAYARSLLRRRIPHEIHDHILDLRLCTEQQSRVTQTSRDSCTRQFDVDTSETAHSMLIRYVLV